MSFYREIGNILGLDWARIAAGYSLINYNGEAVYIEGIKKVITVSESCVKVNTGKVRLRVTGDNLTVCSLEDRTMIIRGVIISAGEDTE